MKNINKSIRASIIYIIYDLVFYKYSIINDIDKKIYIYYLFFIKYNLI